MLLYQQLEQQLREDIRSGQLAVGERLPSVRRICQQLQLSKSTVLTAYARLEAEGLIHARPRSGYFVSGQRTELKQPDHSQPVPTPLEVSADQVLLDIMRKGAAFDLLPSPAHCSGEGNEPLRRCLARAQRRQGSTEQHYYDDPQGLEELREQLAQRLAQGGGPIGSEELVITHGCQHGLLLALLATTQPGDVVALESPGFYGNFQLLQSLGLRALELPCSPSTGLSPEALELALQHWPVKVLMVSPAYATPTGACMTDEHKQQLLQLARGHNMAIIEDDIYAELHFGMRRPRTLYSYEKEQLQQTGQSVAQAGNVILCSSFSKCLSRDLRLGWVAAGRYRDAILQLKLSTAIASSRTLQLGVSEYLQQGGLDRFLRQRRIQLQRQCHQWLEQLAVALPGLQSSSQPTGGLSVWLELEPGLDTLQLYYPALREDVVITPGRLFTSQPRYQSFLRLSFAHPLTPERHAALERLGKLLDNAQTSAQP
jgi:DNA-binding transcriptional MocR family regulator